MKGANEQLETAVVIKTGNRCEQLTGETSTRRAERNGTRGQESTQCGNIFKYYRNKWRTKTHSNFFFGSKYKTRN